jgi:hypothetical protein
MFILFYFGYLNEVLPPFTQVMDFFLYPPCLLFIYSAINIKKFFYLLLKLKMREAVTLLLPIRLYGVVFNLAQGQFYLFFIT